MKPPASAAQACEDILRAAIRNEVSDVHFQWVVNGLQVRFRESGLLIDHVLFDSKVGRKVVSHMKVLADMNIAEKRKPQDGRAFYAFEDREVDLRLASVPTLYGENLTIRVLDREISLRSLEHVGLDQQELLRIRSLIRHPHGLILVTGPTGAGKTTTLYAALQELNQPTRNIITVEDPVEYDLHRANQIGVQPGKGLDFREALRAAFRHDPDVIMVGEIRDAETAAIAVRAALSGHLVLSTLHTESAIGAYANLVQLGVSPYLAASALLGVVTQQLVRRICSECRHRFEIPLESLGEQERSDFEAAQDLEGAPSFAVGTGCDRCHQTGFHGRTGIFEILEITPQLRQALIQRSARREIEKLAKTSGWQSLQRAGFRRIVRGETTIEEVLRVCPVYENDLETLPLTLQ